jgi:hypothetical protein
MKIMYFSLFSAGVSQIRIIGYSFNEIFFFAQTIMPGSNSGCSFRLLALHTTKLGFPTKEFRIGWEMVSKLS